MAVPRGKTILVLILFSCCIWHSSLGAGTGIVSIKSELVGRDNLFDEEDTLNNIKFSVVTDMAPSDGNLEIVYSLDDIPGYYDVEPGFDFIPDLGEFPATITMTILEGETESNEFMLQILDDCHQERDEGFKISPVGTSATTSGGTPYEVMTGQSANFVIREDLGDQEDDQPMFFVIDSSSDLVYFEGEQASILLEGRETCSYGNRGPIPIDATCTATIVEQVGTLPGVPANPEVTPDQTRISFTVTDNSDVADDATPGEIVLQDGPCCPLVFNHVVSNSQDFLYNLVDDDFEDFYGIVFPAQAGRQGLDDISVAAVTTQLDVVTTIEGNKAVCPYNTALPTCQQRPLESDTGMSIHRYGTCIEFPKPKKLSRDRFGSYIIHAEYDSVQSIPIFVLPASDTLKPLYGPTITINNMEDVVLGVAFSRFTDELRWSLNGQLLKRYSRKCNFKIRNAEFGRDDGYYEVYRNSRGKSGYRTVVRLIIRPCPEGQFIGSGGSCMTGCSCLNGGVCGNVFTDDNWRCVCPLGFYGKRCQVEDPGQLRIGHVSETKLSCKDLGKGIPADCKGALFCFRDPLGCHCARGYWGPKCDRVCPFGRYGWNCKQRCHCRGPKECDPKTGRCIGAAREECAPGFDGSNCQEEEL